MKREIKNKIKLKKMNKYCKNCGRNLYEIGTDRFNEVTGKEIIKFVCSNRKCKSNCESFGHSWVDDGGILNIGKTCGKCGEGVGCPL